MTKNHSEHWSVHWPFVVALWLAALAVFVLVSAATSRTRLADELEVTGRTLHRLVSQRVAQHDAHLTSLIALTGGAEPAPEGAVRQVMESISRFYPRIAWLALVSVDASANVREVVAVPSGAGVDLSALGSEIAAQTPGRASVYPAGAGRYLLAKRAAVESGLAVILMIDAARLLEPDERPGFAHLMLSLDGDVLVEEQADATFGPEFSWWSAPRFEKVIDGEGQQLRLVLDRTLPLVALVPPRLLLGFAVAVGLVLMALAFALGQRAAVARSLSAARAAEERLAMQERETRLAHASRVNAMGELASGIAHELTQPLTAMLSRSQAALRLAETDEPDIGRIAEALGVNVREAKRAGEMLRRMRDYASNRAPELASHDLNRLAAEVVALTGADLERRGVTLVLEPGEPAPHAMVDAIEMEQVLHNLIRNAAEAAGEGGTITLAIGRIGDEAKISVRDDGPGIPGEVLPRLFTPFFTTKQDGMGLGLSLCASLVERVNGRIEAENDPAGGARFIITLPLAKDG